MDEKKYAILGEAPIGKLIWKMSIPAIIGILSYNLYNIVDTIYISRGIGAYAAGGIAITFPLFILLSAISTTLGAGAASIISRSLGKNDIKKASRVAANTFTVFWSVAILITIFGLIYMEELLYAMGVTVKLMPYAKEYTRIILIGAMTSTGFSNIIRAEGSSRYAMYQWVIPVTANIILDPIFIFALRFGIQGAAIATVISQCISVVMSVYYFFLSGKSHLKFKLRHFILDFKIIGEIIMIGLPSFIQLASHSLTIVIINNVLRKYGGDLAISTYGIASKISVFLMIPLQGIIQGIQPIIGYNYGSNVRIRVNETLSRSSVIAVGYGILISLTLFLLSEQLIFIFSSDAEIIHLGSNILRITCLGTAFSGVHMIQAAYFQAVGKSRISLVLSLSNYILCFVPALMLLSGLFGLNGVWFSFPLSSIIALGISSFCIIGGNDERRRTVSGN